MIDEIFALGRVGYVAFNSGMDIIMRHQAEAVGNTTSETNFYEELLVNPTLLKLAAHRGHLDCGGLKYIAVGYGDFTQLILRTRDGSVSVGLSRNAPAREVAVKIQNILEKHSLDLKDGERWTQP